MSKVASLLKRKETKKQKGKKKSILNHKFQYCLESQLAMIVKDSDSFVIDSIT
jgi:hypothetical protein